MRNQSAASEFSGGVRAMPREMTRRERAVDLVFLNLQVFSQWTWAAGGVAGFALAGWWGAAAGVPAGWLFGRWMRYSLGRRGANPTEGFFIRMRERAEGSRRGLLEWVLEKARGNEFTRAKCAAIWGAWAQALEQLRAAASPHERQRILAELDRRVKKISYD